MPQGLGVRITNTADGSTETRTYAQLPVRIGRNPLNDLRLDHSFVSQFHAVLDQYQGVLVLRDLGSTNGTVLRSTGRVPSNHLVSLAADGNTFAIVSLVFQAYFVELPAMGAAPQRARRPLAVTSFLSAVPAPPSGRTRVEQALAKPRAQYHAYRTAWAEVLNELSRELAQLAPEDRQLLLQRMAADCPAANDEADFRRLLAQYGAAVAVGQAAAPTTQQEAVALQGLRELAADFVPQLGTPEGTDQLIGFLGKLQATLDVFIRSFIPLRDGYQQFEAQMAIRQAPPVSPQPGTTVESARDPRELGGLLLDWRDPRETAIRAIETTFADLMIHQVAMINGIMSGVRTLLAELSPPAIEQLARNGRYRTVGIALGGRQKALWKAYTERYADIAEEKQLFSLLFGRGFARAYDESRAVEPQTAAPPAPARGPGGS